MPVCVRKFPNSKSVGISQNQSRVPHPIKPLFEILNEALLVLSADRGVIQHQFKNGSRTSWTLSYSFGSAPREAREDPISFIGHEYVGGRSNSYRAQ